MFTTPPYKNTKITKPVEVQLQLQKRSDLDIVSNTVTFHMLPVKAEECKVDISKRKRADLSGDIEITTLKNTKGKKKCGKFKLARVIIKNSKSFLEL